MKPSAVLVLAPLLVVACAASAPVGPTSAPAASAAPAAPVAPPVVEGPSDPSEIRCGVDDDPVPIGALDEPPLRAPRAPPPSPIAGESRAFFGEAPALPVPVRQPPTVDFARPRLSVDHTTPADVVASPAVLAQATACARTAGSSDEGERSFEVRLSTTGSPLSVRPTPSPTAATPLTSCLARALCALGTQAPSATSRTIPVRMRAAIVPPTFDGSVLVMLGFGSRAPSVRVDRAGRVFTSPAPPAASPADRAYLATTNASLRAAVLACVRRFPPNTAFSQELSFRVEPGNAAKGGKPRVTVTTPVPAAPYMRSFQGCTAEAIAKDLGPPPRSYLRTGEPVIRLDVDPDGASGDERPPP